MEKQGGGGGGCSIPNHLVLPFEALASGTACAALDWAEVRSCVGVDVHVRVEQVLGLKGDGVAAEDGAFEAAGGIVIVRVGAVVGARERGVRVAVAVGGAVVLGLVVGWGGGRGE